MQKQLQVPQLTAVSGATFVSVWGCRARGATSAGSVHQQPAAVGGAVHSSECGVQAGGNKASWEHVGAASHGIYNSPVTPLYSQHDLTTNLPMVSTRAAAAPGQPARPIAGVARHANFVCWTTVVCSVLPLCRSGARR